MGNKISLGIFVAFAALISSVLLVEVKALVLSRPGQILNHIFASSGFTVAVSGVLLLLLRKRPSALVLMMAGTIITVGLEVAQAFSPTRDAEMPDLVAGLAGVLLTVMVQETAFRVWDERQTLRLHVIAASIGSIALTVLLIFNWSPGTVRTARPDGTTCPATEIGPGGGRLTIGAFEATHSCVETESGGLGLVGPWTAGDLFDRSVLVSSDLADLRDVMHESGRLHLRVQITTDDLESRHRSVVALLRTADGRHVINLKTNRHRLEVSGPNLGDPLQASVAAQMLKPNTTYVLDVLVTPTQLELSVDGEPVSRTTIDSGWYEYLAGENLQFLIGNNAHRSTPFRGVIDWIDINP